MRAGGVNVLDIFAVVLIVDRPEALGHHCFGKAGEVRISWLILATNSAAEAASGGCPWELGDRRSSALPLRIAVSGSTPALLAALVRMSAIADDPRQGILNIRPSTGSFSPCPEMIASACAPPAAASVSPAPGSAMSALSPPAAFIAARSS